MDTLPKHITITNSCVACDGGSSFLLGHDENGEELHVGMEWSIEQTSTGTTRFRVNDTVIPKGSDAEPIWLQIIRDANVVADCLDEDGRVWIEAAEANEQLREAADHIMALVLSKTHQNWQPDPIQLTAEERVQLLLAEGKRLEAMKVYREGNPGASPAEAKAAIEAFPGI